MSPSLCNKARVDPGVPQDFAYSNKNTASQRTRLSSVKNKRHDECPCSRIMGAEDSKEKALEARVYSEMFSQTVIRSTRSMVGGSHLCSSPQGSRCWQCHPLRTPSCRTSCWTCEVLPLEFAKPAWIIDDRRRHEQHFRCGINDRSSPSALQIHMRHFQKVLEDPSLAVLLVYQGQPTEACHAVRFGDKSSTPS